MRTTWRTCARSFGRLRADIGRRAALLARCSIGLVSAAALWLVLFGTGTSTGASTAALAQAPEAKTVKELPELRTAKSDTFVRSDGTRMLKVSAAPINYQSQPGQWTPIDDSLSKDSDGTLHPFAAEVPVSLPPSLGSGAVTVGPAGRSVGLALQGANALQTAQATGSKDRYEEALPGVSASYVVGPTALRETLTLASVAAPTEYRYSLSLDPGLHAVSLPTGEINVLDTVGKVAYRLAAPSVRDSSPGAWPTSEPVHYTLSEDGHTLSLILDSAWLHAAGRAFPVRIDPDVFYADEKDCPIASTSPTTSLCGQPLIIGSNSETPRKVSRAVLRFNVSALPQDTAVLGTRVSMFFAKQSSSTSLNVQAYALEHEFTSSATWNSYDGTHSWPSAGGDLAALSLPTPPGGTQPYGERTYRESDLHLWPEIGITPLVQKWVSEPASNHGMLLKAKEESTGVYDEFDQKGSVEGSPALLIVYAARVGAQPEATFSGIPLDDRTGMSVNVANGNVLMDNHAIELPGTGYDFSLDAYFNSLANGDDMWVGLGSTLTSDAHFDTESYWWDESLIYHDPTGRWMAFTREPSADSGGNKMYLSPPGVNAKLELHENYSATLTDTLSRVKYQFTPETLRLEKIVDPNGNTTTFAYNGSGLTSSVTDTKGHVLTFKYEGPEGDLSSVKDALGRTWKFTQSGKQLTSMTDPDGHKLQYKYNTAGQLTQTTDPNGHLIELSYDKAEVTGKLTRVRRVVNGSEGTIGNKDVITTLSYAIPASGELSCPTGSIGDTVIVSPNGSPNGEVNAKSAEHKTSYCINSSDEVTKAINQRGNPSTAGYDPGTGSLLEYQNPGDTAEGSGSGATNTIAYNTSGAPTKITTGVTTSASLETSLTYGGGTGHGGQVEPSAIQTPFSAVGQKTNKTHKTFYTYDASGNLTTVNQDEEAGKPEVKLAYNTKGQVTESTDPDGNTTKYQYNETTHDLVKIEPPSPIGMPLGATELTYDSLDRTHTVKDGRGITATYTYDGEDRVTKVEYSDGSSVSFKFDADGNTTERVDAKSFGEPYTGVTLYEYDKLNRPTLATTPTANSTHYGYDYDSNLTSLEDAGKAVAYAYGSDDVLTSLTEPENSAHPFKFGYQVQTDNRESTTYPNGLLQCTSVDRAGRLTSLMVFKPTGEQNCGSTVTPSATLEDYALSYAFEEEVEGVKVSIDTPDLQVLKDLKASKETSYEYDTLDRLLKATLSGSPARVSDYKYDAAGNMLINHTYAGETTYTNEHMKYNTANEICAIATTEPAGCASPSEEGIAGQPTYDKDANMTSDGLLSGANKFAYTVRDQLSSVTQHGESAKQLVSHGTGQVDLAAIGSEEVITNVLGVGVTGSGTSAKYYTRGSEGTLLAKRTAKGKPSETEYFTLDPFGSVASLTSAAGAQTAPASGSYQYDSYGAPFGTPPTTFGYEGGQRLPAGLVHFGARYAAPAVGSWTQLDALGGGYPFSEDDPVNEDDPGGECAFDRNLAPTFYTRGNYAYFQICKNGRSRGYLGIYSKDVGRVGQILARHSGGSVCHLAGVGLSGVGITLGAASIASLALAPPASGPLLLISGAVDLAGITLDELHANGVC
jgi:YD repeat-containing protein